MLGPDLTSVLGPWASEIVPEKVVGSPLLTIKFVGVEAAVLPSTTLPAPASPPMVGLAERKFTVAVAATLKGPLPRAASLLATSPPPLTLVPPL